MKQSVLFSMMVIFFLIPCEILAGNFKVVIDPQYIRKPYTVKTDNIARSLVIKLADILKKNTNYHIIYTSLPSRNISLKERITKSNESHGDILISIRVVSDEQESIRDFEVLTPHLEFAEGSTGLGARNQKGTRDFLQIIEDLKASELEKYTKSLELSNSIFNEMKRVAFSNNTEPRYASDDILIGVNMPATLIILKFRSDILNGKTIREGPFLDRIAKAVFCGIEKYHQKGKRDRK